IDFDAVLAGRDEIATFLPDNAPTAPAAKGRFPGWVSGLMAKPFFQHLWFLWFLWWLVVGFAVVAMTTKYLPTIPLPAGLFSMPWCLVWLVPLTAIPQAWMHEHGRSPGFGPDTSTGILPVPHVLLYYAIFFGFGALVHASRGFQATLGSRWYLALPLGLVLFPFALRLSDEGASGIIADNATRHVAASAAQALYAWLMTFGTIGLFEAVMTKPRSWVRYLSDASYWMYLVHLPLVIVVQSLLFSLSLPAGAKFAIAVLALTPSLLLTYQLLVRHTRLGVLLNGPRRT
ncbi:MAG: acyltransferase family protein, partial [Phycisphaerales bacterium]